jgi:hypothetical protein
VCDSVEQEECTIVACGVTWRLDLVVELVEDNSSLEYMEDHLCAYDDNNQYHCGNIDYNKSYQRTMTLKEIVTTSW